jgi:hypothetical protein
VAGADHLGAEFGESMMGDRAGLEIAYAIGRVMQELYVPDPALVRFLPTVRASRSWESSLSTSAMIAGCPSL